MNDQVTIEIDGRELKATRGQMLIEVADAAGITIPRFCYHKKLSVAANCRMCLVEVEKVAKPLPACATPVNDGMRVFTRSPLALAAQKSVMEFLLINHPLDCPICDQGGECELQDVAMGFGGDVSRYNERKRVVKDKDIGPLIATDMTRCIHCTRCVRFGEEIAGVRELGATGRGEFMEIGTYVARSVESELSGNVIDLCPVGALTNKPFRFSARAWEMTQKASVSPHDCVGANLYLHVHRGQVKRVVPRDNEAVNETWIADRDRYSYQGLASADRLLRPAVKQDGEWRDCDWETALAAAANALGAVVKDHGPAQLGALVAPTATTEEHYLMQRLMRALGSGNVDHRVRQIDFADGANDPLYPGLGMTLAELEGVGAALVVGSDTRRAQPLVNLRLRKAALAGGQVFFVNAAAYDFNFPVAAHLTAPPGGMVDELAAVAAALGGEAPGGVLGRLLQGASPGDAHRAAAAALKGAERGLVLLGDQARAHPEFTTLRALAGYIAERTGVVRGFLGEANGAGAWLAGAVPHRRPGGRPAEVAGRDARAMLAEPLKGYLLLGLEPELDCADGRLALAALHQAEAVVSLTAYRTPLMEHYATVLLPMGLFAETAGTFVNAQGDWQSFQGAVAPPGEARPAWKILRVLGNLLDLEGFDYQDAAEVRDEVRKLADDALPSVGGPRGEPLAERPAYPDLVRVPRLALYGSDPLVRRADALQATTEARRSAGYLRVNPGDAAAAALGDEDLVAASQGEGAARLHLRLDPTVAPGAVLLDAGVASAAALGPLCGAIQLRKA